MLSIFRLKFTLIQSLKNLPSKLKPQKNCFKITEHLFNRMLRHSFLRVGEDIFLQYFILPPFKFLLCFSLYCLLASTSEARDGNKGNNKEKKIDTQTEQKLKGGKNKGNFLGQKIFSKIFALIVSEGQIRLEVDKVLKSRFYWSDLNMVHSLSYFIEQWKSQCIMELKLLN